MSVKWEKQEGNEGVLTVEVDAETFNKALDDAFKKVVKQVSIPGFRRGKVPRGLFEQRFGVESLYQDALDILLPVEYPKAIDEAGIDPVDRPEIDVEKIEKGESLIMNQKTALRPITPAYDPWEAYLDVQDYGEMKLTNIEFTTTTLCNMRCEHCAVGYTLQPKDPNALPLDLLLRRLDEVPLLRSISITGGEPMLSLKSVREYVVPLLKYAHERGVRTQINSNLTLDLARYEEIIPYLDVLHISHNWGTVEEFATACDSWNKRLEDTDNEI
ncbi:radical SAM/CxCxxxxC motif protein YfkAB [Bacillus subtilis]|nr:radical SAM/CxCxxxxC motif protein YfkAB [Bacillus subtilis]